MGELIGASDARGLELAISRMAAGGTPPFWIKVL